MFNKKDPLIDSVKNVMKENEIRRDAEKKLNEELGIASKKALPFEHHANYDALLEQKIAEALKGNQHKIDANKNNKIDAHDFKLLRSQKKVEEESKEITQDAKNPLPRNAIERIKDNVGLNKEKSPKTDPNYKPDQGPSEADKEELNSKVKDALKEEKYSAKEARAGKDIGKPGKMFKKIASDAAERYGSEESGKKVAGAILKKLRAKTMKEEEGPKFADGNKVTPILSKLSDQEKKEYDRASAEVEKIRGKPIDFSKPADTSADKPVKVAQAATGTASDAPSPGVSSTTSSSSSSTSRSLLPTKQDVDAQAERAANVKRQSEIRDAGMAARNASTARDIENWKAEQQMKKDNPDYPGFKPLDPKRNLYPGTNKKMWESETAGQKLMKKLRSKNMEEQKVTQTDPLTGEKKTYDHGEMVKNAMQKMQNTTNYDKAQKSFELSGIDRRNQHIKDLEDRGEKERADWYKEVTKFKAPEINKGTRPEASKAFDGETPEPKQTTTVKSKYVPGKGNVTTVSGDNDSDAVDAAAKASRAAGGKKVEIDEEDKVDWNSPKYQSKGSDGNITIDTTAYNRDMAKRGEKWDKEAEDEKYAAKQQEKDRAHQEYMKSKEQDAEKDVAVEKGRQMTYDRAKNDVVRSKLYGIPYEKRGQAVDDKEYTSVSDFAKKYVGGLKEETEKKRAMLNSYVKKAIEKQKSGEEPEEKRQKGLRKATTRLYKEEENLSEKAPPGAKFERMVKHIKKGYAKDGLTDKEKSIAYATAWKAKNKEDMKEAIEAELKANLGEKYNKIMEQDDDEVTKATKTANSVMNDKPDISAATKTANDLTGGDSKPAATKAPSMTQGPGGGLTPQGSSITRSANAQVTQTGPGSKSASSSSSYQSPSTPARTPAPAARPAQAAPTPAPVNRDPKNYGSFSTNNDSKYGFARSGSDEDTPANFFASDKRRMDAEREAAKPAQPAPRPAAAARPAAPRPSMSAPAASAPGTPASRSMAPSGFRPNAPARPTAARSSVGGGTLGFSLSGGQQMSESLEETIKKILKD